MLAVACKQDQARQKQNAISDAYDTAIDPKDVSALYTAKRVGDISEEQFKFLLEETSKRTVRFDLSKLRAARATSTARERDSTNFLFHVIQPQPVINQAAGKQPVKLFYSK